MQENDEDPIIKKAKQKLMNKKEAPEFK